MRKTKSNYIKEVIKVKRLAVSILTVAVIFSVSTTAFGYSKVPASAMLQDPCPTPFKNVSIK